MLPDLTEAALKRSSKCEVPTDSLTRLNNGCRLRSEEKHRAPTMQNGELIKPPKIELSIRNKAKRKAFAQLKREAALG